jgi:hypothetical protein
MKLGITLFSLTLEWLSRKYTLEDLLAEIAQRDLGPGLEMVGFQTIRDFPKITPEFVRSFQNSLEKHELIPSCLGANIDLALRRDRLLTTEETVEYVSAQITAAKVLGFPILRVQINAKPEVLRKLVPVAEKANVVLGMELHSPYGVHHPIVVALRELYDEVDSPYLGFIPDCGLTMRDLPPGILQTFRADGIPEPLIALLRRIWHSDLPVPERFAQVREMGVELGATPKQLGNLNLALSMCDKQAPEAWNEIMPRVVHVHGKFYGFDESGQEPSIDFARIIRVFTDGGFSGFMSSEWEGHAFTGQFSGFDMVTRHQKLCRDILAGIEQQSSAAIPSMATKIS